MSDPRFHLEEKKIEENKPKNEPAFASVLTSYINKEGTDPAAFIDLMQTHLTRCKKENKPVQILLYVWNHAFGIGDFSHLKNFLDYFEDLRANDDRIKIQALCILPPAKKNIANILTPEHIKKAGAYFYGANKPFDEKKADQSILIFWSEPGHTSDDVARSSGHLSQSASKKELSTFLKKFNSFINISRPLGLLTIDGSVQGIEGDTVHVISQLQKNNFKQAMTEYGIYPRAIYGKSPEEHVSVFSATGLNKQQGEKGIVFYRNLIENKNKVERLGKAGFIGQLANPPGFLEKLIGPTQSAEERMSKTADYFKTHQLGFGYLQNDPKTGDLAFRKFVAANMAVASGEKQIIDICVNKEFIDRIRTDRGFISFLREKGIDEIAFPDGSKIKLGDDKNAIRFLELSGMSEADKHTLLSVADVVAGSGDSSYSELLSNTSTGEEKMELAVFPVLQSRPWKNCFFSGMLEDMEGCELIIFKKLPDGLDYHSLIKAKGAYVRVLNDKNGGLGELLYVSKGEGGQYKEEKINTDKIVLSAFDQIIDFSSIERKLTHNILPVKDLTQQELESISEVTKHQHQQTLPQMVEYKRYIRMIVSDSLSDVELYAYRGPPLTELEVTSDRVEDSLADFYHFVDENKNAIRKQNKQYSLHALQNRNITGEQDNFFTNSLVANILTNGNEDEIKKLLQAMPSWQLGNTNFVLLAAEENNSKLLQQLFNHNPTQFKKLLFSPVPILDDPFSASRFKTSSIKVVWHYLFKNDDVATITKLLLKDEDVRKEYAQDFFIEATTFKSPQILKFLLSRPEIEINPNISRTDKILFNAIMNINIELIKLLLAHPKIDLNIRNSFNETALEYARRLDNKAVLAAFFANDPRLKEEKGASALHRVITESTQMSDIENSLYPTTEFTNNHLYLLHTKNEDGETPLHLAIKLNKLDFVQKLLQVGAYPEVADLDKAIELGNLDIFKIIRKHREFNESNIKLDPNQSGFTLYQLAAKHGNWEIIALIDDPKNINDVHKEQGSAVFIAAAAGKPDVILALVRADADPNLMHQGRSPLHVAIANQDINTACQLMIVLIENGANFQARDFNNATPLDLLEKLPKVATLFIEKTKSSEDQNLIKVRNLLQEKMVKKVDPSLSKSNLPFFASSKVTEEPKPLTDKAQRSSGNKP